MTRLFAAAFVFALVVSLALVTPTLAQYEADKPEAYVELPDGYSDYREHGTKLPTGELEGIDGLYSMVGPNGSALIIDVTERKPNVLIEATIDDETGPVPSRGFEFRDGAGALWLNQTHREPPAVVTLRGKGGFLLATDTLWTVRVRFTETGVELVSVGRGGDGE